jgi:hypothetical protein
VTVDVDRLRAELHALRKETGTIQPRALWERAKPKNHWLHDAFEWDNAVAADRFRDAQAAALIRVVKVVRDDETVRELHPVMLDSGRRTYEWLGAVTERETWRDQLSSRLQTEIAAAVKRWVPLGRKVGLDVVATIMAACEQAEDRVDVT